VGFDWETVEGIFTKLLEETSELRVALSQPDGSRREEEVGDLLFVAVNLARFLGFDPEVALKHSNLKFKLRFQNMEADAARSGQRLAQLSKDELEVLWDAAKKGNVLRPTRKLNDEVPPPAKIPPLRLLWHNGAGWHLVQTLPRD